MAITFDGTGKIIQLDGAISQSIKAIYSQWVDWAATSDNGKYLAAFSTVADPPSIPVYATLENGWKVRPLGGAYTLTLTDGFLYDGAGGDPIDPVASGVEPRIRYENPVLAVGFSAAGLGPADVITALQGQAVDGGYDLFEALSLILSATTGKGGPTGSVFTYRDVADTKDRITATVTSAGSRTAVALDPS